MRRPILVGLHGAAALAMMAAAMVPQAVDSAPHPARPRRPPDPEPEPQPESPAPRREPVFKVTEYDRAADEAAKAKRARKAAKRLAIREARR